MMRTRVFLVVLVVLLGLPWPARAAAPDADLPAVALLPFNGKEAAVPPRKPLSVGRTSDAVGQLLVARSGPRLYRLLSQHHWLHEAERRFHGKTSELQGIARALRAELIVGGWVERMSAQDSSRPYRLTVALYNSWAEPLGQVSFDLDTEHVDPDRLVPQAGPLYQMVDQALGLTTPGARARRQASVTQQEDSEPAPLPKLQPVQGPDKDQPFVPPDAEVGEMLRRPPWRPLVNLEVGYLYNTRQLRDSDDQGRTSGRESRGGAHGLRLHAEVYPLALLRRLPLWVAGLGVRVTALLPFWGDIPERTQSGAATGGRYAVSEQRVEAALRWHWNFMNDLLRPDVDLEALYGYHQYALAGVQNVISLPVPSAAYQYLGGTAGVRLHILKALSARVSFTAAGLLDLGPMGQAPDPLSNPSGSGSFVYGPGGGWLWRGEISTTYRVWRGLSFGLGGYYEQVRLSFNGTGDIPVCTLPCDAKVTAATDAYGGFYLNAGYVY